MFWTIFFSLSFYYIVTNLQNEKLSIAGRAYLHSDTRLVGYFKHTLKLSAVRKVLET